MMTAVFEIVHLFVDDGALALWLVACCALVGLAVILLPPAAALEGLALLLGCAAILLTSVLRAARKARP